MKGKRMKTLNLLLLLPFLLGQLAAAEAREILTVAIFDFESREEVVRPLGPQIATLLNARLSAEPHLILVERAELDKALGEQELGLSGTVTGETAARVGQLTGAKVLITGRVFRVDRELLIVAKVIGTETSRVYGELVKGGASASITDLSAELADRLIQTLQDKAQTLVAVVPTRAERLERIRQSLQRPDRPTVSVSIIERHFGGPTIDPAAETEIGKVLLECGFPLVDDRSDRKPDIVISGEAFSEFGVRRGNLVSCKARVEIKVRDRASGDLIVVDRQTSVAVDLSEQIAAKTALELAALELAERLLPNLVK
jgi:hypothetical protein